MNLPSSETISQRRAHLAAEIARQRGELAEAYRNIGKPIHYAEYGLRGFGFFRKNSWVFLAAPALLKVTALCVGLIRNKPIKAANRQRQSIEDRPKGILGHAAKWGGHGWRLFKFYRRVRRFFP